MGKASFCGRRSFMASAFAFAAAGKASGAKRLDRWYRGNLHMHTYLSDGHAFPEEAALLYRRFGYDFIAYSDHNKVFSEKDLWITEKSRPKLRRHKIRRFARTFPGCPPVSRKEADGTVAYRLKSFEELSAQLNDPGKFLLINGSEYHNNLKNGHTLHCNTINTGTGREVGEFPGVAESLDDLLKCHAKAAAEAKRKSMFILNHPFGLQYDIDPMLLAERTEVRFFEIANALGAPFYGMTDGAFTAEKFWDVALAHRAMRKAPLLYAVATDDTHLYNHFYDELRGLAKQVRNKCHVRVRARELSADALLESMEKGDFYASNGLELEDVRFDPASGTLSVSVAAKPGRETVIRFYGTKRGFDRSVGEGREYVLSELAAKTGKKYRRRYGRKRRIRTFSDDIGVVLKEVRGSSASYRLEKDDLYVRAKVFVAGNPGDEDVIPPVTHVAWTQPYTNM